MKVKEISLSVCGGVLVVQNRNAVCDAGNADPVNNLLGLTEK
jgi:hypothetical protein